MQLEPARQAAPWRPRAVGSPLLQQIQVQAPAAIWAPEGAKVALAAGA